MGPKKCILASSCLSVRPHVSLQLPLDGFSWILTLEIFKIICGENSNLVKIRENVGHFTWRSMHFFFFDNSVKYFVGFLIRFKRLLSAHYLGWGCHRFLPNPFCFTDWSPHHSLLYKHSQTHAVSTCRQNSNSGHFEVAYTRGQNYMYVNWSPAEIQTPTHCNVIGQGMAAPLPLLSPSSILP